MITQTTYVLAVNDLAVSARYYDDVLGFTVHEIGDDGWRVLVRDQCRIMAGECADATPPRDLGDHAYFAYWTVDDARALYEEFRAAGADIGKALRDEPWGMREFSLTTVDGHRLMVGEELAGV